MKIKYFLFMLIIFISVSLAIAANQNKDIPVQAQGTGSTGKSALLAAKRNAVEQGIGTFIISQTEINNFELQKDIILSRAMGSVKKVDILEKIKRADGSYLVKINAIVSLASIKSDLVALKILLESMDKPRMMVMVAEKNGKTGENTIINYLREKQFTVVDVASVAALMKKGDGFIQQAMAGDPVAAARIGSSNGAEYMIIGKVTKDTSTSDFLSETGLKSGQASISAKIINCSGARIIATFTTVSGAVHTSVAMAQTKATEKAAIKLMDQGLFEKTISSFQDMINNGVPLDVTIKNVTDFQTQKAVRRIIKSLNRVVSVTKRSFSKGRLKLTVLYKGNADSFSEAADGKIISGKVLSVSEIEGSSVVIYLK